MIVATFFVKILKKFWQTYIKDFYNECFRSVMQDEFTMVERRTIAEMPAEIQVGKTRFFFFFNCFIILWFGHLNVFRDCRPHPLPFWTPLVPCKNQLNPILTWGGAPDFLMLCGIGLKEDFALGPSDPGQVFGAVSVADRCGAHLCQHGPLWRQVYSHRRFKI